MLPSFNRRGFLTLTAGVGAAAALSACGTSGPSSPGSAASGGGDGASTAAGSASWWSLTSAPNEGIHKAAAERYNAMSDKAGAIEVTFVQNDAYKQKIRTAVGAGQAPTLIYGWGGGTLRTYVAEDQVVDLTDWLAEDGYKDEFSPGIWPAATAADGKIYAVPLNGTQPVILFYNKRVFDAAGAEPPKTYEELLALAELFNSKGVAPMSLAGQSRWTSMMWLEYLLDRIGGAQVFQNIFDKKQDAWLDPAVVEMAAKVQELVDAEMFVKGFASMAADNNSDQALMWTDQAAMMLHGGWTYGGMKQNGGDFVTGGHLGFLPFPTIEGGKGDIKSLVGNPCNYVSIYSQASEEQQNIAKDFIKRGIWTTDTMQDWVNNGIVPVKYGADEMMAVSDDKEFLSFVYDALGAAPDFTQSWDQALDPTAAEALLNNIDELFLKNITPEQFAENMNGTL